MKLKSSPWPTYSRPPSTCTTWSVPSGSVIPLTSWTGHGMTTSLKCPCTSDTPPAHFDVIRSILWKIYYMLKHCHNSALHETGWVLLSSKSRLSAVANYAIGCKCYPSNITEIWYALTILHSFPFIQVAVDSCHKGHFTSSNTHGNRILTVGVSYWWAQMRAKHTDQRHVSSNSIHFMPVSQIMHSYPL